MEHTPEQYDNFSRPTKRELQAYADRMDREAQNASVAGDDLTARLRWNEMHDALAEIEALERDGA